MSLHTNQLNIAIDKALHSNGNQKEANKAYLEFIKENFIIPIEKVQEEQPPTEAPKVLYQEYNQAFFLPVFNNIEYFNQWAYEIKDHIQLLKLSGVDLLKGIGENVYVCLNIGSPNYKEFNPSELARMRSMVLKFFK